MRHRKATVKLNRTSSHRKAMFRNMVTSLFKYERIRTTDPKAKELKKWADNLITLAKRGDLHARRQALSIIREKDIVHKLFENAPERYANTDGGYTRITKIGRRPGDAAPMSMVELVVPGDEPKKKSTKKKTRSVEKAKTDVAVDETPEDPTDQTAVEAAPESDSALEKREDPAAESEPDPKPTEEMEKEEEETEAETSEDQTDEEKSED